MRLSRTLTSSIAVLGAALLIPATALADGAERLSRMLSPLETYSADFEQQILDGSGQRLQEGTHVAVSPRQVPLGSRSAL